MIFEILRSSFDIVFLMLFSPSGLIILVLSFALGYVSYRQARKRFISSLLSPSSRYGSSHKRKVKR